MKGKEFDPASTKEASNNTAENRDRRLKFNSDTIELRDSVSSCHSQNHITGTEKAFCTFPRKVQSGCIRI